MEDRINEDNVRMLRRYLVYLREAEGLNHETVNHKERVIDEFIRGFGEKEVYRFNENIAIEFKENQLHRKHKGNLISKKTVSDRLNAVKEFLFWYIQQPGYRTKINPTHIQYLKLSRGVTRAIKTADQIKVIPSLNYVFILLKSIICENEVSMRDKALIAFVLVSGLRCKSLTSLRLKDVDLTNLTVTLNPLQFSCVKYEKALTVRLLVFSAELLQPIKTWYRYLVDTLHYKPDDPFFPMTDVYTNVNKNTFEANKVKPEFWKTTGSINKIFKDRANAAKLVYYHPHSFRRLHYTTARRYCRTMEELSAVSRNLGHDYIDISDGYYGNINPDTRIDILERINFNKPIVAEELEWRESMEKKVMEILDRLPKNDTSIEKKNIKKNTK